MEIIHGAQITAVAAAADELRENGFALECIKRLNPPTYQLKDIEQARELSARLLKRKVA
jgi:hydroxypyruvate isomerase